MSLHAHSRHQLEGINLRHGFGRGAGYVQALDGVSIKLTGGCFTILRGPSGSGKSTLLSLMSGLVKPQEGDVFVDEYSIWSSGIKGARRFRAEQCGFVFQGSGLFPGMRALDQVALPLRMLGDGREVAKAKAIAALEKVGMQERAHSMPHEMSGGQNQRVAFARMIAKQPRFIFCDEPTSALDRSNGQIIGELLSELAANGGASILCMTHDERLLPFASEVRYIEDGRLTTEKQDSFTLEDQSQAL